MKPEYRHRFVGSRVIRQRSAPLNVLARLIPPTDRPPLTPRPLAPIPVKPGVQMRFRTDGWNWADQDIASLSDEQIVKIYDAEELAKIRATPPAKPGDTWRIFYAKSDESAPDVLAGYAICCPTCNRIHNWTGASNCQFQPVEHSYTDDAGKVHKYKVCGHSGKGSCWTWTGSAEENKLTARASLLCHGCGYHGFLTDGVLTEC